MVAARIHMLFRRVPFRIILPVVLTVLLFVMTIFLLILPMMQDRLLDGVFVLDNLHALIRDSLRYGGLRDIRRGSAQWKAHQP